MNEAAREGAKTTNLFSRHIGAERNECARPREGIVLIGPMLRSIVCEVCSNFVERNINEASKVRVSAEDERNMPH